MLKVYECIKCSNMCTSGDNSRRNSYSICAVNNCSSVTASDNRKYDCVLFFFVLLHVLTCDLLQILISIMLCYVTQCFEENKCYINLTFQCFKMPFIVYISGRLLCACNTLSILIQYNFSAVYGGDWSNCVFLESDSVYACRWIPALQRSRLPTPAGWEDCVSVFIFFVLKRLSMFLFCWIETNSGSNPAAVTKASAKIVRLQNTNLPFCAPNWRV
jgi:hypothetical protein